MKETTPLSHLKALADPSRLRLLHLLEAHELSVGELTSLLGMTQSRVSGHLAVLREAGLVRDRRQGTSSYYAMEPSGDHAAIWDALRARLPEDPQYHDDTQRLTAYLAQRRERNREFFDRASESWNGNRSESLGHGAGLAALAGLLPQNRVVLDLGTGTGTLLPSLANHLGRVIAVDSSSGMLEQAKVRMAELRINNVSFIHGELESLPIPSHSVDGVVANMVLHHIAEPAQVLREIARVLRPDGRGVIVDFSAHDEQWLLEEERHLWAGFD
ncbi:MAG: metalloregulator ArsR/SmtB family transcription factor, partial [Candidatus Eisenbacteria bacterium]|nr:metalloregulator ArsR/SmtB family transcription factor [Candidatus Eisenbacteria bacterium]